MIQLNNNYKEIANQAKATLKRFSMPLSDMEIFFYMKNYSALCFFYYLNTNKSIIKDSVFYNKKYNNIVNDIQQQINTHKIDNFLHEKQAIQDLFITPFLETMETLATFFESSFYQKNGYKPMSIYPSKNGADISLLCSFFTEQDSQMKELFLETLNNKRIFNYKEKNIIKSDGITLFNYHEGFSDVFIRKKKSTIDFLDTFVHEFGHVWDFYNLRQNFSFEESSMYAAVSDYSEVIPTLNDLKFYKYLIDNNINKDEALLGLANNIYNYSINLYNIILLSQLDDEKYKYAVENFISEEELEMYLKNQNSNFPTNFCLHKNSDIEVNFEENLTYSFGLLLGCYLLEHEEQLPLFLKNRTSYSSISKLENIGISIPEVNKAFVKTINHYFN